MLSLLPFVCNVTFFFGAGALSCRPNIMSQLAKLACDVAACMFEQADFWKNGKRNKHAVNMHVPSVVHDIFSPNLRFNGAYPALRTTSPTGSGSWCFPFFPPAQQDNIFASGISSVLPSAETVGSTTRCIEFPKDRMCFGNSGINQRLLNHIQ